MLLTMSDQTFGNRSLDGGGRCWSRLEVVRHMRVRILPPQPLIPGLRRLYLRAEKSPCFPGFARQNQTRRLETRQRRPVWPVSAGQSPKATFESPDSGRGGDKLFAF